MVHVRCIGKFSVVFGKISQPHRSVSLETLSRLPLRATATGSDQVRPRSLMLPPGNLSAG